MAEATTPHDAVFKTFLSCVETARDFIKIHLPPSLLEICKLATKLYRWLSQCSFIMDNKVPIKAP